MGQKVSPIGLRIGINKDWESRWYAGNKDFSKYLNNDVKIRKFLTKKLKDAAVSSILIERNATKQNINIVNDNSANVSNQSTSAFTSGLSAKSKDFSTKYFSGKIGGAD